MFGANWKYYLGRKFNVKWSIMHTIPYHTYLLTIWEFLLMHTYHTYLWEWSIMPYLPYLPYLLIGFHYAILTILTYGNPLCHTYHTYSWDSIMPYLPYLLMGFDFYSALACNWQTSKFDICIAQRKQSTCSVNIVYLPTYLLTYLLT